MDQDKEEPPNITVYSSSGLDSPYTSTVSSATDTVRFSVGTANSQSSSQNGFSLTSLWKRNSAPAPKSHSSFKERDIVMDEIEKGMNVKHHTRKNKPTFLQVVGNNAKFPYSLKSLQEFMTNNHSIEQLEFWLAVFKWKEKALDSKSDTSELFAEQDQIFRDYIKNRDLNISGQQYLETTTRYSESVADGVLSPTVFDEAFVEIEKLIKRGPFEEYLRIQDRNLTPRESFKRYVLGVVGLAEALAIPWLSYFVALLWDSSDATAWRFGYLFVILKWFQGIHYMLNGYYGV
ncbi:MAG: hypothetical protein ACTSUE_08075 [Promethearchaeota archaeon]